VEAAGAAVREVAFVSLFSSARPTSGAGEGGGGFASEGCGATPLPVERSKTRRADHASANTATQAITATFT